MYIPRCFIFLLFLLDYTWPLGVGLWEEAFQAQDGCLLILLCL